MQSLTHRAVIRCVACLCAVFVLTEYTTAGISQQGSYWANETEFHPSANSVRISWSNASNQFLLSFATDRHLKPQQGPTGGRSGNEFVTCANTIIIAIACARVVRCHPLIKGHKVRLSVDARGAALGSVVPNEVKNALCSSKLFSNGGKVFGLRGPKSLWRSLKPPFPVEHLRDVSYNVALVVSAGVHGPGRGLRGVQCNHKFASHESITAHVRSGDIMRSNPHPLYPQPPFLFWWRTITSSNFTHALVFVEDLVNPAAKLLYEISKQAEFRSHLDVRVAAPFDEVLSHLVCARNVIIGRSTISSIVGASWNLEKIVVPFDCRQDVRGQVLWHVPMSRKTYSPLEKWRADAAQKLEMLLHSPLDLVPLPCEG